jgi:hypothetical protein
LCPRAYLWVPDHGDPHLLPCCGYLPWRSSGLNTDSWRPPWGHRHDHRRIRRTFTSEINLLDDVWRSNLQTTPCFRRDGIRLLDEQVTELAVPRRSKIKLIFFHRPLHALHRSEFLSDSIPIGQQNSLPSCLDSVLDRSYPVRLGLWVCDRITPAFSHTVGKETTNPNATRRSKQKLNKAGPLIPEKQKQHLDVLPLCWMHTQERTRKLQEYCLVHTAAYASTTSTT